ncbi:MAG: hypothetical protein H7061_01470 [Bdellovibrionaceae bacterium]|nr:hypothetical protein [Bdellovibrio sp.]
MKFLSNLRNRLRTNLLKNNRGQGATEYILLLVVVVGLVMLFKKQIGETMSKKMGSLSTDMDNVTSDMSK